MIINSINNCNSNDNRRASLEVRDREGQSWRIDRMFSGRITVAFIFRFRRIVWNAAQDAELASQPRVHGLRHVLHSLAQTCFLHSLDTAIFHAFIGKQIAHFKSLGSNM